jgi:hypothetical protein
MKKGYEVHRSFILVTTGGSGESRGWWPGWRRSSDQVEARLGKFVCTLRREDGRSGSDVTLYLYGEGEGPAG